jgi:hypothetical protein
MYAKWHTGICHKIAPNWSRGIVAFRFKIVLRYKEKNSTLGVDENYASSSGCSQL